MATFAFSGGTAQTDGFGQMDKFKFVSTWAAGDVWSLSFAAGLLGNLTLGKGNIADQTFSCVAKLKDRIYLGMGGSFALSANSDVTLWEEQNPGAAVISFQSQYGPQDTVSAFSSLQGRLVVVGKLSTQFWSVDADPANMALVQVLDNTGSPAPLSVKSIGDLDVLYLDYSGIRSLRAKEVTLNSSVNDIGTAVDTLIRESLLSADPASACAVVEPTTKQYWLYLDGSIYVLSNYPQSKIVAWTTYKPRVENVTTLSPINGASPYEFDATVGLTYKWTKGAGETQCECGSTTLTSTGYFVADDTTIYITATTRDGTLQRINEDFVPSKFVVFDGQIYVLGTNRKIYCYGGTDNNTYDRTRAVAELPWLDLNEPSINKQGLGLDVAMSGPWTISVSMNPRATSYTTVVNRGSSSTPSATSDSTYDLGHFNYSGHGTHLKMKAVSDFAAVPAKLSKLVFLYSPSNTK